MKTNNRSKTIFFIALASDMRKMLSITGCLPRNSYSILHVYSGFRSKLPIFRLLDPHTTLNFEKKGIWKEWRGILHWSIHIFQMRSLKFCLHEWPQYLLQKRICCCKHNLTTNMILLTFLHYFLYNHLTDSIELSQLMSKQQHTLKKGAAFGRQL
jgi:hypothetical protein